MFAIKQSLVRFRLSRYYFFASATAELGLGNIENKVVDLFQVYNFLSFATSLSFFWIESLHSVRAWDVTKK